MKALRPDEDSLDQTHSVYVDHRTELVIPAGRRNLDYLKQTVRSIYQAVLETEDAIHQKYTLKNSYQKKSPLCIALRFGATFLV